MKDERTQGKRGHLVTLKPNVQLPSAGTWVLYMVA